jgi:signal transduction histidine kinase
MRYAVGTAVLVVALLDALALLHALRSQERLRARAVQDAWQAASAVRPRLQAALRTAPPSAALAEEVLRATHAQELELFDPDGLRLFAYPDAAPVTHRLAAPLAARVAAGEVVTLGPVAGSSARLLTYASVQVQGQPGLCRLAVAAPELVDDLRERRQFILGHAVSLTLLAVVAGMAFYPRREDRGPEPGRALVAYEQAMERLRDRGERLEQQIRDAAPLARAGELTSGIAHEVRNGLGTILGYARLIERGAGAAEAAEAARAIRQECETLETVVRRFLDFVRQEHLRLAPFDAVRLLSRVAAREERSRPGARVEVKPGRVPIVGDEEMLERAAENLVRNARDAAGPEGRVVAWADADAEGARLVVEDDGPGMPEVERAALRPFYTTKPGGLGLGLAIVHKIAALHGGRVLMGSRSPRGLVATLQLPHTEPAVTPGSDEAETAAGDLEA